MSYDPRPAALNTSTSSVFESVSGPNSIFGHLLELQYEDYDVDTESLKDCVLSAEKDIKVQMSESDIPFKVQGNRDQTNS